MAAPATEGIPLSTGSLARPLPKTKFREIVLQILFSLDIVSDQGDGVVSMMMREVRVSKRHVLNAFHTALAISDHKEDIDSLIDENIQGNHQGKISLLEKNILRLLCHERFSSHASDINNSVLVSEAIRLTRKFGHPPAAAFVHAVLDTIFQKEYSLSFTRIPFPSNL